MNVLFVDQFSALGGAQLCLLDLIPAMTARGGALTAAIPGRGPLAARLGALAVDVREIACGPYRSGAKTIPDALRFATDVARQARTLAHLVTQLRIDLIYANGARVWPAAALASRRGIPVIFHAHNHIEQATAVQIARWAIRSSDATVIACCESVARPWPRQRLAVIPNGTADLGFRARIFRGRRLRIGMIGGIAPNKGQLEFVQAAHAVRASADFVICGAPAPGEMRYFEAVRNAARGLPLRFLGWRDDVAAVLAGLDVVVIASRREGLPRVMLEAMSAGVPVVAFDTGGIGEALDDGVTGFLAQQGSLEALKSRLAAAIADPERLRSVAASARALWERQYTLARYRAAIMQEVDRALRSPAASETAVRLPCR